MSPTALSYQEDSIFQHSLPSLQALAFFLPPSSITFPELLMEGSRVSVLFIFFYAIIIFKMCSPTLPSSVFLWTQPALSLGLNVAVVSRHPKECLEFQALHAFVLTLPCSPSSLSTPTASHLDTYSSSLHSHSPSLRPFIQLSSTLFSDLRWVISCSLDLTGQIQFLIYALLRPLISPQLNSHDTSSKFVCMVYWLTLSFPPWNHIFNT